MPGWLQEWWPLIAVVWTTMVGGFVGWVGWSMKQRFVPREAFAEAMRGEHEDRKAAVKEAMGLAGENRRRLDLVESRVADLPTHKDLATINEGISELGERMAGVEARQVGQGKQIDTVEGTVTRIHQWLLEQKK